MAHDRLARPAEGEGPRPRPLETTAAAAVRVLRDFVKKLQVSGWHFLSWGVCRPGSQVRGAPALAQALKETCSPWYQQEGRENRARLLSLCI